MCHNNHGPVYSTNCILLLLVFRRQECFKDSPDILTDIEESLPIVEQQFEGAESFMHLIDEEFENIQTIFDLTV